MAENGINGASASGVEWTVGLMNTSNKYLTAESFGFKVNASGLALKKKQIWTIEQDASGCVYIRSCLGRYMTSDRFGNIKAEAEEKDEDAKFSVEYSATGKWAFKNEAHGIYFRAEADEVKCHDKKPTDINWWSIQLYVHPLIHLRNVNRKLYAHLDHVDNNIVFSETVPWGLDALMCLDFLDGKYTLKSCDNQYVNRDGTLQSDIDENTMFDMEIQSGAIAFKDCKGYYLTAVGVCKYVLKSRNKTISKDELFTIEDSHPQCEFVAMNGKRVSVKQGVDVSANQSAEEEIADTEIFQMEFKKLTKTWAFRASTNNYWNLITDNIHADKQETTKSSFFTIEWQNDGTAGIKGVDDKYLSNKKSGILHSTGKSFNEDINKFTIIVNNRPILVLRCEYGFVGCSKGNQYSCNKAKYDTLSVTSCRDGTYTIKGQDGKYWSIGDGNLLCSGDNATKFHILFCGCSMMAIRAPNGCYLNGEQNGLIKATATETTTTALWEF